MPREKPPLLVYIVGIPVQSRLGLCSQNLRVSVNAGHESEPDGPADGFCDFTLVDWPKTGFVAVFNASHRRHIFRHDREVLSRHSQLASHSISKVPYNEAHLSRGEVYLVEIKRILVYGVKSIRRRAVAHLPLPHL